VEVSGGSRGSRWPVIAAFALVGAATQVLWLTFAPVTSVAATHYGVSENAIGWLANVFPLVYVVLAIPAGLFLDRWFRAALITGAVLTAAGGLLRLAGDHYLWLLAGQTVVAIAQPLVLNAITGITGRYLTAKDRPTGIAIGTASTFAGMVAAFVLGAVLPNANQLGTLNAIGAWYAVIAALVLVVALRRPGEQRHAAPPAGLAALRSAWGDPFIRRLCALVFMPFGVSVAMMTYTQALLEPEGVSSDTASLMLLFQVVAGVLGCLVIPIWAARNRREVLALLLAGVISSACCLVLAIAPGVGTGFATLTIIGLALLPALPVVLGLAERRTGEAEGTAAALIWLTGQLGGVLVASVVGLLVHRPTPAFLLMAAATLVALPVALSLRRPVAALSDSAVPEQPLGRPRVLDN
jgi:predicted MFS family arabinose efflux permease